MFESVIQATENFCIHQIRSSHTIQSQISREDMLISSIDTNNLSGVRNRIYLAMDKNLVQKISTIFLEEEKSDDETLQDMLLETTNLIVGSAKVIAQDDNSIAFDIETPFFIKNNFFDIEYDNAKNIKIEDSNMVIAIKELGK